MFPNSCCCDKVQNLKKVIWSSKSFKPAVMRAWPQRSLEAGEKHYYNMYVHRSRAIEDLPPLVSISLRLNLAKRRWRDREPENISNIYCMLLRSCDVSTRLYTAYAVCVRRITCIHCTVRIYLLEERYTRIPGIFYSTFKYVFWEREKKTREKEM